MRHLRRVSSDDHCKDRRRFAIPLCQRLQSNKRAICLYMACCNYQCMPDPACDGLSSSVGVASQLTPYRFGACNTIAHPVADVPCENSGRAQMHWTRDTQLDVVTVDVCAQSFHPSSHSSSRTYHGPPQVHGLNKRHGYPTAPVVNC